jgi:hypothetical protein
VFELKSQTGGDLFKRAGLSFLSFAKTPANSTKYKKEVYGFSSPVNIFKD